MRATWIPVALATAVGCKGSNESKPQTTTTTATTTTTPADAPLAPSDERCANPCRFLATSPLASVGVDIEKACGKAWSPSITDDCDQADYLRNCIYADAGYTFKKKKWRAAFGGLPWYKARADFKDSDLSTVATANVSALKQQVKECRAGTLVSPSDIKIVEAWLDTVRAGKPDVPAIALDSFDKVAPQAMKDTLVRLADAFTRTPGDVMSYRYTHFDWDTGGWDPTFPADQKIRTVAFGAPQPAKPEPCPPDEECDFGIDLMVAIDASGKIAGVSVMLSACPLVYRLDAGAPRYQGELLRNLASPQLEVSQPLAVEAPCTGVARYRISEEKAEVTQLDALTLAIGDVELAPDVCAAGTHAICANDGVAHRLAQGEWLDVSFTIPAGTRCGPAHLEANGHYVRVR